MAQNGDQLLRIEGISKRYGGVHALEKVQFDLNYGEVHALVGENGAGKSTLINVIGGITPRSEGHIFFKGKPVHFDRPQAAQHAGISIIHQELSMMPSLTVMENMFMGNLGGRGGWLNWRSLEKRTRAAMSLIDLDVDPYALVRDLSISQRQMVEIARALSTDAQLIIMDEPNSSLSDSETERLFTVIESLKTRGIAILYVSHKIDEVLHIADRITVFRDGFYVGTIDRKEATEQAVINMMVGRDLDRSIRSVPQNIGDKLLEVKNLTGRSFQNITFTLRKGEILGFSGLVGAGRSELMRAIFGADRFETGTVMLNDRPVRFTSPSQAIKAGVAMVPEDRKVLSLFMPMAIYKNMSMAQLPAMQRFGLNERKECELAQTFVAKLDIRLDSIQSPVSGLSGGNQQKTVLGRWLATDPQLLILDEPTHGVDVGAKAEIYDLMRNLAQAGMGIILISSELPEVLALAHRIVVMHEGHITGIVDSATATEEGLMAFATGVTKEHASQESVEEPAPSGAS